MVTGLHCTPSEESSLWSVVCSRVERTVSGSCSDEGTCSSAGSVRPRVARFEESLAALCPGRDNEADAATFASFLEAHWDETAMFLNFMESERLKSNAVAAVRDGAALDDALLAGLLDDAAATMVLRDDAARDEYRANLKLTRL